MNALLRSFILVFLLCGSAQATTIVKVDLGNSVPDFEFIGGTLSTIDDGIGATTGDQNTNVLFEGLLDSVPDITGELGSFTLDGVVASGNADVLGGGTLVNQLTAGGNFSLYDSSNVLLLEGSVTGGTIFGSIGAPASGSFTATTFGTLTGGSLLPLVGEANQIALAFSMDSVNGGAGFSVSANGQGHTLDDFTAAATGSISAVPEPGSIALLLSGALGLFAARRRAA